MNKFDKNKATHFRKSDEGVDQVFLITPKGRLYVWVLDRWFYECWAKHYPHKLEPL